MADENSGFKVADRRLFSADGELREAAESAAERDLQMDIPSLVENPEADLPMNFQTLVFSFSTTALLQLGMAPDPVTGKQKRDLPSAKQTIDILEILQQKTQGNLTEEEAQLLDECLYDLKMTYVKLLQTGTKP